MGNQHYGLLRVHWIFQVTSNTPIRQLHSSSCREIRFVAAAWPSVCFWAPALQIMVYIQVPKLSEQLPGAGPGAPCPSSSNSNELFTHLSRKCARVAPHDTRASFNSHPVRTGFTASSTTSCLALPRTKLRKGSTKCRPVNKRK